MGRGIKLIFILHKKTIFEEKSSKNSSHLKRFSTPGSRRVKIYLVLVLHGRKMFKYLWFNFLVWLSLSALNKFDNISSSQEVHLELYHSIRKLTFFLNFSDLSQDCCVINTQFFVINLCDGFLRKLPSEYDRFFIHHKKISRNCRPNRPNS